MREGTVATRATVIMKGMSDPTGFSAWCHAHSLPTGLHYDSGRFQCLR